MDRSTIIFGGTGFIGRHLCCYMQTLGGRFMVVSRAPDLEFLKVYAPNAEALTVDEFYGKRDEYLSKADTLIYMASTSVPATNKNQPWLELADNVEPAFSLFSAAVEANPEIRLVYLSSGGTVYGAGHKCPISETARLEPISPYGYGKITIEECIRFLGRTKGLSYAILRVANPVGIWQSNPRQGIVSVTLHAIQNQQPITLFNGGDQVRDFLDADDLAAAIILAANARGQRNKTWNIGSGQGYKIYDVVTLIEGVTQKPVEKIIVEARKVDSDYSVLDCSSVFSDLGWKGNTNLEESIHKIWNGIKNAQLEG